MKKKTYGFRFSAYNKDVDIQSTSLENAKRKLEKYLEKSHAYPLRYSFSDVTICYIDKYGDEDLYTEYAIFKDKNIRKEFIWIE